MSQELRPLLFEEFLKESADIEPTDKGFADKCPVDVEVGVLEDSRLRKLTLLLDVYDAKALEMQKKFEEAAKKRGRGSLKLRQAVEDEYAAHVRRASSLGGFYISELCHLFPKLATPIAYGFPINIRKGWVVTWHKAEVFVAFGGDEEGPDESGLQNAPTTTTKQ